MVVRPDLIRINSPMARLWRERGHNAATLAAAVNVSASHIYNLAAGRSKPSYDLVQALCAELQCRPDELFPQLAGNGEEVTGCAGDAATY